MADCCDCFGFTDQGDTFGFWQGLRGPYYTPHVAADGTLSWTNNGGLPNPAPVDISGPPGSSVELRGPVASVSDLPATASSSELWLVGSASPYDGWFYNGTAWQNAGPIAVGPAGEDGVSPKISVEDITGGHRVTITDAEGTQTFDVLDGSPGTPGAAGVSPAVTVTEITGGHRVTITDAEGTQTFDVMDGSDGSPGTPGAAGVSPAVTVTDITGGHRVTITDAEHPQGQTFDVLDGATGPTGPQGPAVPLSDTAPLMDDTASPGRSTSAARADHVHPSDTAKQDKIAASGILKGNGSGSVSAAVAGTDYLTPATNYSPMMVVQRDASLSSDILGKTIAVGQSGYGTVTVTIPKSTFNALPDGAEFAVLREVPAGSECIIKVVGVPIANEKSGWVAASNTGIEVKIPVRYGMVAMKKIYNLAFLVTGNVEVVS